MKKESVIIAPWKTLPSSIHWNRRRGRRSTGWGEEDLNIWPAGSQRVASGVHITRPEATNARGRSMWRTYGENFHRFDRDDLLVGWAELTPPFVNYSAMPPRPYGRSSKYEPGHLRTVFPGEYLGWTGGCFLPSIVLLDENPWSRRENTFPYRISRSFIPDDGSFPRTKMEYTTSTWHELPSRPQALPGLKTREKIIVAVPRGASLALYYRNLAALFRRVAKGVNDVAQDRTLFLKTVDNEIDIRMSSGDLRKVVIPTRVVATYKIPLDVSIDLGGIKRVVVKFEKEKIKKRAASKKAQVEQWKIAAKRAGYYEYDAGAGERIVTSDKLYDYLMATKKRRKLTPLESEWLDDVPVYDSDDEE